MSPLPLLCFVALACCLVACEPDPRVVRLMPRDMHSAPDPSATTPPQDAAVSAAPQDRPLRLLFIGNSFTNQGPVSGMVGEVARVAGWPAPYVAHVAPNGRNLSFHCTNPDTLKMIEAGRWDAVVLQDASWRPTDVGDPEGFKHDAAWLFDYISAHNPSARVVLLMTWARHPDADIYPGDYADAAQMQAQLREHYQDAWARAIPALAKAPTPSRLALAPVGDAWEHYLAQPDAMRLHSKDNFHAGVYGRWLSALTIYGTIYGQRTRGLGLSGLTRAQSEALTRSADDANARPRAVAR